MAGKTSSFTVEAVIPASPAAIYEAWMSSDGHAAMTGGGAEVDGSVGGEHSAWDGYITGKNLELVPGRRIVQSWRTSEFADNDPDSKIEVTLEPVAGGTKLILRHTNIPAGQADSYRSGWTEHYFDPMKAYFGRRKRSRS